MQYLMYKFRNLKTGRITEFYEPQLIYRAAKAIGLALPYDLNSMKSTPKWVMDYMSPERALKIFKEKSAFDYLENYPVEEEEGGDHAH